MRGVQRGRLAANATSAALRLPVLVVLVALVAVISGCATHSARLSAASPSPLSAGDRNWLNNVHQADLAEIEAGQLAKVKGTSPAVRSAGATLAGDLTAFDAKLVRAAAALKVKLPDYLTNQQALARERLGSETGQQFDHDFTATMLTGHPFP
jgi:putative membrane protein